MSSSYAAAMSDARAVESGSHTVQVMFGVQNLGQQQWEAVRLGYLILDPATGALMEDGGRANIAENIPPRAKAQVKVLIDLPEEDGHYQVLISPLIENVTWFYQHGSDALLLEVEVTGGIARVLSLAHTTSGSRARGRLKRVVARAFLDPFRVLWRNHSLIASMVRRDIHGRYRGSLAGLFWTVINPLLMMLTYFFVFALVLKVRFGEGAAQQGPTGFLLYFIAGMLPWLAFSEAIGRSAGVVIEHRMLVKRVVFPIEVLPVNLMAAGLVSEFFGLLVFLAALLTIRHGVPLTVLYLPFILGPQILLTAGLCWFLAGLGVFLRDTGQFLGFFLTLLFFATPICYEAPKNMAGVLMLNPIYVLVRAYRAVFLDNHAPAWNQLGWLTLLSAAVFFFGFAWFYKSRRAFPDVL